MPSTGKWPEPFSAFMKHRDTFEKTLKPLHPFYYSGPFALSIWSRSPEDAWMIHVINQKAQFEHAIGPFTLSVVPFPAQAFFGFSFYKPLRIPVASPEKALLDTLFLEQQMKETLIEDLGALLWEDFDAQKLRDYAARMGLDLKDWFKDLLKSEDPFLSFFKEKMKEVFSMM